MKKVITIVGVLLVAVLVFGMAWRGISDVLGGVLQGTFGWDTTEAIVQYYQRMDMLFLVTTKDTMHPLVKRNQGSLFLGSETAWMEAEVVSYWGIDCSSISRDSIEVTEDRMVLMLPEPELLDFKINLGTRDQLVKRSALRAIVNALQTYDPSDDLWVRFEEEVKNLVLAHKPSKDAVLDRLYPQTELLSGLIRMEIELR